LVYGSEAILPTDVAFGAPRIQFYEEGEAEQTRRVDLDSLEEQRLATIMNKLITANNSYGITIATLGKLPSTLATSSPGASRRPTTPWNMEHLQRFYP
jgi:hypothetical protein